MVHKYKCKFKIAAQTPRDAQNENPNAAGFFVGCRSSQTGSRPDAPGIKSRVGHLGAKPQIPTLCKSIGLHMVRNLWTFIAALLLPMTWIQAQPGVLDPDFGLGGKRIIDLQGDNETALSVKIQPDGKILIGGSSNPNSTALFTLIRLLSDGSYDPSFGTNGIATCTFNSSMASNLSDMVLYDDGSILVGGSAFIGFSTHLALAKFQPNGLLDSTFSSDGLFTYNPGSAFYANALGVFSDGRIVVGGSAQVWGSQHASLLRITPNGTIDNSFGLGAGMVSTQIAETSTIMDLVVTSNDEIIAVGGTSSDGFYNDALVLNYVYTGALDNSFDSDGIKTIVLDAYDDYLTRVIELPGNKYLMCGVSNVDFALVQLNSNGSANTAFSGDGIVRTDMNDSFDELHGLDMDPMGHIVVAGYSGYNLYDNAVLRYNANGSLDNLFSLDGKTTVDMAGGYDYVYDMAVQADGKIVSVGSSDVNGQTNLTVFRLQGVCPAIATNQNVSICAGEALVVGGNSHSTAGVYTDVITLPTGCDSTVVTNLSVLENNAVTQEVSISGGESYSIGNNTYTIPGTYVDVLVASNGCDSVVTTILTVNLGIGAAKPGYGSLAVRPIPFDDVLIVDGTRSSDVLELSDVSGKVILRTTASDMETRLSTSHLQPGVYWLVLRSELEPWKLRKVLKLQ